MHRASSSIKIYVNQRSRCCAGPLPEEVTWLASSTNGMQRAGLSASFILDILSGTDSQCNSLGLKAEPIGGCDMLEAIATLQMYNPGWCMVIVVSVQSISLV